MKNKKIKKLLLFSTVAILGLIFIIILTFSGKADSKDKAGIKLGFVMSGHSREDGWNGLHYDGIKQACEELDIESQELYKMLVDLKENGREIVKVIVVPNRIVNIVIR